MKTKGGFPSNEKEPIQIIYGLQYMRKVVPYIFVKNRFTRLSCRNIVMIMVSKYCQVKILYRCTRVGIFNSYGGTIYCSIREASKISITWNRC